MKNFILTIACLLALCASQAQTTDSTYQITSGGRTDLLTKRYGKLIKSLVENVKAAGHVLKVSSQLSFTRAMLIRWTKNAQNQLVKDEHPVKYNPSTFNLQFPLDVPPFKGGLQYDVLLYVNPDDSDYSWRIHLLKK